MFYLVRFTEGNPEGRIFRKQHNCSVAPLPFSFAKIIWIKKVLNERTVVGNSRLHLLEAHTQSLPRVGQTGNMLRKLALDLLDLLFECLDLSQLRVFAPVAKAAVPVAFYQG